MAHSSSGLGRWPLTSVTGVQIPYALQMWSVYVIRSLKDSCCYVSMSEDVSQRLKTHNSGKVTSTKSRRPFELATGNKILVNEYFTNYILTSYVLKNETINVKEDLLCVKSGRVVCFIMVEFLVCYSESSRNCLDL